MSKFFHAFFAAILLLGSAATTPATADPTVNFIMGSGDTLNGYAPIGTLLRGPGGRLWGVTSGGGAYGLGVIFCLTPPSRGVPFWVETVVHSFSGGESLSGARPLSGLVRGPGGRFYGTTALGGVRSGPIYGGVIYSIDPTTTGDTYIDETRLPPGLMPYGPPIFVGGFVIGTFAGVGNLGGLYSSTIGGNFDLTTHISPTTLFTPSSQDDGFWPVGGLLAGPNGILYGTMTTGGNPAVANRGGVVFSISHTLRPQSYRVMHTFDAPNNGSFPVGTLIRDAAFNLYGVTAKSGPGGPGGRGTVYRLSQTGSDWTYTRLATFAVSIDHGSTPMGVSLDRTGRLFGSTEDGVVFSLTRPSVDSGQEWTFNRIVQIPSNGVNLGNAGYRPIGYNDGVVAQASGGAPVHDAAGQLYLTRTYQNAVVQITGTGFAR